MTTPDPGDGSIPQAMDMLAARMAGASEQVTVNGVSLDEALEVTNSRAENPNVVGRPVDILPGASPDGPY